MSEWAQQVGHRITASPLVKTLGMVLVEAEPNRVLIKLPFRQENTTVGDQVHGGAIASLIDTVATAVAWSGADPESPPSRGTTVNLEVAFMTPALATDLVATGTVPRRGRSLCFCHVDVQDENGQLISQGRAVYKLG